MAKRVWKEWKLVCREVVVHRQADGLLVFTQFVTASPSLTPREARRLSLKLAGDSRD